MLTFKKGSYTMKEYEELQYICAVGIEYLKQKNNSNAYKTLIADLTTLGEYLDVCMNEQPCIKNHRIPRRG